VVKLFALDSPLVDLINQTDRLDLILSANIDLGVGFVAKHRLSVYKKSDVDETDGRVDFHLWFPDAGCDIDRW
jgi:hypothetical protein